MSLSRPRARFFSLLAAPTITSGSVSAAGSIFGKPRGNALDGS